MHYRSNLVKCPFYRDETKNTIRCEGIFSEALSNNFEFTKIKKSYRNEHCCRNYNDCQMYKMLDNKYALGDKK